MNRFWMPDAAVGFSVVGFIRAGLFSSSIIASGVTRYLMLFAKFFLSREAGADRVGHFVQRCSVARVSERFSLARFVMFPGLTAFSHSPLKIRYRDVTPSIFQKIRSREAHISLLILRGMKFYRNGPCRREPYIGQSTFPGKIGCDFKFEYF